MVSAFLALACAFTPQGSFDSKVSSPGLLTYPSVQRELKMSPQQISDVALAEKQYWDDVRKTHDNNSEVEKKAVLRYLDANQLKRLREISLQEGGPVVLMADFVAERIGADKAKQREIQRAFNSVVEEIVKPMTDEISKMSEEVMRGVDDPKKAEAKAREVDAKASLISNKYNARNEQEIERRAPARILAVLTRDQMRAWTELLGKPFPMSELKKHSRYED